MNEDIMKFDIPQYIADELNNYIQEKKDGRYKCMKLENIKALIGLAIFNNRITEEQGKYIISTYCNK